MDKQLFGLINRVFNMRLNFASVLTDLLKIFVQILARWDSNWVNGTMFNFSFQNMKTGKSFEGERKEKFIQSFSHKDLYLMSYFECILSVELR